MICDEGVKMPRRATIGSAGYDIFAPKRLVLNCTEWTPVDLGFRFEPGDVPPGWCVKVMVRSSMGNKKGLHLRNAEGLIDSDYYLNLRATLQSDTEEIVIEKDQAFLQFVLLPHGYIPNEIEPMATRTGGEGSTS